MRIFFIPILLIFIFYSCNFNQKHLEKENEKQQDILKVEDWMNDSTKNMVAVFPLYFDSTNVLIQPSGLIGRADLKGNFDLYDLSFSKNRTKKGKSSDSSTDLYVGNVNEDVLTGRISNLFFDDLDSGLQRMLTRKAININKVVYLRGIAEKTKKQYLLYSVNDQDTNHDNQLDHHDIESLYISKLNGQDFQKLSDDKHQYQKGKLIPFAKRYYFTTIEDINGDGNFDNGDKYHYYYIDFSGDSYKVIEYNPISN